MTIICKQLNEPAGLRRGSTSSFVKWVLLASVIVNVVLVVLLLSVLLMLAPPQCLTTIAPEQRPQLELLGGKPRDVSIFNEDANFSLSGSLRLINRENWLAQQSAVPLDPLAHPVPYIIISHSATEPCMLQSECALKVRTIQTFHIESKGWWDIGYNFLVGGDGFAYVGRGWDFVGTHAYGYNNRSIGINFIGTFHAVLPPKKQMEAAKQLIQLATKLGKIAPDFKLLAHRQVSATESPGKRLFEELKTWPHWAPAP